MHHKSQVLCVKETITKIKSVARIYSNAYFRRRLKSERIKKKYFGFGIFYDDFSPIKLLACSIDQTINLLMTLR